MAIIIVVKGLNTTKETLETGRLILNMYWNFAERNSLDTTFLYELVDENYPYTGVIQISAPDSLVEKLNRETGIHAVRQCFPKHAFGKIVTSFVSVQVFSYDFETNIVEDNKFSVIVRTKPKSPHQTVVVFNSDFSQPIEIALIKSLDEAIIGAIRISNLLLVADRTTPVKSNIRIVSLYPEGQNYISDISKGKVFTGNMIAQQLLAGDLDIVWEG